jgi:hypothetical protein
MAELADVFREVVSEGELKASPEQWKVVNAILNCRTEALGGHLYRCSDCGDEQPRYNSCRNRHCPKCQAGKTSKWLEKRAEELLPVPYFHVVFTIPHELNGIALQNKEEIYNLFFQAVSKTLKEVSEKRYGGKIGYFSILHTWGQKLEAHPHVHCVIPGVILNADESVKVLPENHFLPHEVLRLVFKAVFLTLLEKRYEKLSFHGEQALFSKKKIFKNLLNKLWKKDWIVYLKKPFSGPHAVLKYLARYTHRVAISNSRIISCKDGKTTFSYKDYSDDAQKKYLALENKEFTRRFLLHTLPKQFVRIRHFGFMANAGRKLRLEKLKSYFKPLRLVVTPQNPPCCSKCQSTNIHPIRELKPISNSPATPQIRRKLPKTKELPLVA